jgi:hypothetical protein
MTLQERSGSAPSHSCVVAVSKALLLVVQACHRRHLGQADPDEQTG